MPPSNPKALQYFVKVGRECSVNVELIEKKDYGRLAEFDALFIRETTGIDHYTYQFAKKAESEGMVVIDDPDSILKCTNKVYLDELLRNHRIRTPKTVIVRRDNLERVDSEIAYPIVLKIPDGSFSRGVFKVNDRAELLDMAGKLFKSSDLLLAQEFLYTEFDWRVGILNKAPLFVCQYFMSKEHWQIYHHEPGKGRGFREGEAKTFRVEDAPEIVVKNALKAANLIGNGFYGVDLKQTAKGVVVIEVNDNPNLDHGIEDLVLKEELYRRIVEDFVWRLDRKKGK
jgi:glutathione synthase/RimK-type ligase-like ATP-grasp enzyme